MPQNPTPWGEQCAISFQSFVFEYGNICLKEKVVESPHSTPPPSKEEDSQLREGSLADWLNSAYK